MLSFELEPNNHSSYSPNDNDNESTGLLSNMHDSLPSVVTRNCLQNHLYHNFIIVSLVTNLNYTCSSLLFVYILLILDSYWTFGMLFMTISSSISTLFTVKSFVNSCGCQNSFWISHIGMSFSCLLYAVGLETNIENITSILGFSILGASHALWSISHNIYFTKSAEAISPRSIMLPSYAQPHRDIADLSLVWSMYFYLIACVIAFFSILLLYYGNFSICLWFLFALSAFSTIMTYMFRSDYIMDKLDVGCAPYASSMDMLLSTCDVLCYELCLCTICGSSNLSEIQYEFNSKFIFLFPFTCIQGIGSTLLLLYIKTYIDMLAITTSGSTYFISRHVLYHILVITIVSYVSALLALFCQNMMSDSGQASDVDNIKNISNNFVSRKYEYEKNQIDRSQSVTSKYHLLLFCAFIMISSVGAMVVYPIEFHENNIYFNLFAVICILSAASAVYENSCKYVVACLCGEDCIYAFQFINFSTSFSSSVSLILYILLPNWCFVTGLVVMIILGILSILCYRVLELSY